MATNVLKILGHIFHKSQKTEEIIGLLLNKKQHMKLEIKILQTTSIQLRSNLRARPTNYKIIYNR